MLGPNCPGFYQKLIRLGFKAKCRCFEDLPKEELHNLYAEDSTKRRGRELETKAIRAAKTRKLLKDTINGLQDSLGLPEEENLGGNDDDLDPVSSSGGALDDRFAYRLTPTEIAAIVRRSSMKANCKRILKNKCIREPLQRLAHKLGKHLRRIFKDQRNIPNREINIAMRSKNADTAKSSIFNMIAALAGDDAMEEATVFRCSNQRQGLTGYATHGQYRFIVANDFGIRY